jgi:hypothetical protein
MTFSPSKPIKDLNNLFQSSSDAFDRVITQGVENDIDIVSQHKFSPERLRLFLNGNRESVQYDEIDASKFSDDSDRWTLKPGSGEKMRLQSAGSCTYVVGTEMRAITAFKLNQSLQSGDVVRIGPRNTEDGWFIEQRGSDHTDTQVDIKQLRGGTETVLESNVELGAPLTEKSTITCYYNWYNVGHQRWVQTSSSGGEQTNTEIGVTSTSTGTSGPEQANLNLYMEVVAGSSTTGLEFEAGSMSFLTQAQAKSILRGKPVEETVTVPSTNDVWHPVYAFRIRPGDSVVNANILDFEAVDYSNDAKVQLAAVSVDPSKTDATGWGVPSLQTEQNSALQDTENVSEVPSDSGTQTNPGSTGFKFGGHILSYTSLNPAGNDYSEGAIQNPGSTVKSNILSSDVIVVLAKSPSSGGDVTFNMVVGQNW